MVERQEQEKLEKWLVSGKAKMEEVFLKFENLDTWKDCMEYWRDELSTDERVTIVLSLEEEDLADFIREFEIKEVKWILKRIDTPDRTRVLSCLDKEGLEELWRESSLMHQRTLWNSMPVQAKKLLLYTFSANQWQVAMDDQQYIFNFLWKNTVVFLDCEREELLKNFPT